MKPSTYHQPRVDTSHYGWNSQAHEATPSRRTSRPTLRIVNSWVPDATSWIECTRCNRPALLSDTLPACAGCGGPTIRRHWRRPTSDPLARRTRHPPPLPPHKHGTPLPEGEYRIKNQRIYRLVEVSAADQTGQPNP